MSLPAPPVALSFPREGTMVSSPPPPVRTLMPSDPRRLSALDPPVAFSTLEMPPVSVAVPLAARNRPFGNSWPRMAPPGKAAVWTLT